MKCPSCCSEDSFKLWIPKFYHFEEHQFDFVRCKTCGLIRVGPLPSDRILEGMYEDSYFESNFVAGRYDGTYEEIFKKRSKEFYQILDRIERYTGPADGSFFEIGAAGGAFLKHAQMRGWDVHGLEFSGWGSKHCREKYGLDVDRGNFLTVTKPPSAPFQVIFLGDVFEHFVDPQAAVKKLKDWLRPEGCLVMMLPMYVSSFAFCFLRILAPLMELCRVPDRFLNLIKLRLDAQGKNPPYHVFEYSKRTISRLLTSNGFEVLAIKGDLPIPEFLTANPLTAEGSASVAHEILLLLYRAVRWMTENLNFPLVRAIVIARKKRT